MAAREILRIQNGYPTSYFWEYVFQKDSMMDIIQKFIHLQVKEEKKQMPDGSEQVTKKKRLIFPRYWLRTADST